jgi:putative DNA primase/helicase
MAGNHEPKVANVDDAMLRRIKILPFNIKVPKEKQIGDLDVKLIEKEGAQILAWMIEGAQKWLDSGLNEPQALVDATQQYELEQDALATWLTEMCEVEEEASESGQALFQSWKQWCHENLEEPGTKNDFVARLRVKADDFGFEESKHCGPNRTQRGFKGVQLRTLYDEDIA